MAINDTYWANIQLEPKTSIQRSEPFGKGPHVIKRISLCAVKEVNATFIILDSELKELQRFSMEGKHMDETVNLPYSDKDGLLHYGIVTHNCEETPLDIIIVGERVKSAKKE